MKQGINPAFFGSSNYKFNIKLIFQFIFFCLYLVKTKEIKRVLTKNNYK